MRWLTSFKQLFGKKKGALWGLGLIFVIAGVIWSLRGPTAQYETVQAVRGPVEIAVEATGAIEHSGYVDVGAEVSGRVAEVFVEPNQVVRKGQLLAIIDPSTARSVVRAGRGRLASAQGSYDRALASISRAQAAVELSEAVLRRRTVLQAQGLLSTAGLDEARATHDGNRALLAEAIAQRASASGDLEAARAEIAQSESNLARTQIVAPVDGVVISRRVEPGQTLAASFQTPTLFRLGAELTPTQLSVAVGEADIAKLRVGQRARFEVAAFPGRQFDGYVSEIRSEPRQDTGGVNYVSIVTMDRPQPGLLAGMTALVTISISRRPNAIRLPLEALTFSPTRRTSDHRLVVMTTAEYERQKATTARETRRRPRPGDITVWRVDGGGLTSVPVSVGIRDEVYAEILSGNVMPGQEFAISEHE